MSRDGDEFDPSDWLTSQFETGEVAKPKPATGAEPEDADNDAAAEPAAPEPVAPEPVAPEPVAPVSHSGPVSATPAGGGFNWDLKPSSAVEPPAPVVPSAAQAPAAPEPDDSAFPPTVAYTPPPLEPELPPTVVYTPPPFEPDLPPTEAYTPPPLVAPPAAAPPTGAHVAPPPERGIASVDVPTQAMSLDDVADAQAAEPGSDMPAQAYTMPPWEPFVERTTPVFPPTPGAPIAASTPAAAVPRSTSDDPTSALDTLFAETQFEEYEEVGVKQAVAPLIGERDRSAEPRPKRAPLTTLQKTLMWVAGGLVAILALVALFLLGEKLGAASATAPPVPAKSSAASAPPQPASTTGPVAAGSYLWNQLNGGECLQPFTSAWATKFTVVDCATSHTGQLLFKGTLPDASGTAFPSAAQFSTEIKPLCTSSKVINYDTAKAVNDLQVSFSYPATAKDWSGGDRTYYCFASRASGGALPASVAVAK